MSLSRRAALRLGAQSGLAAALSNLGSDITDYRTPPALGANAGCAMPPEEPIVPDGWILARRLLRRRRRFQRLEHGDLPADIACLKSVSPAIQNLIARHRHGDMEDFFEKLGGHQADSGYDEF